MPDDDLAAVRARLEDNLRHEMPYGSTTVLCGDIRALLDALTAAEQARDALQAERHKWHECYMGAVNLAVETQAKVDRLAALELAARDLANSFAMARSNDEWFMAALEVVRVVRELDTPPAERSADD